MVDIGLKITINVTVMRKNFSGDHGRSFDSLRRSQNYNL